jgi:hypothetical protein
LVLLRDKKVVGVFVRFRAPLQSYWQLNKTILAITFGDISNPKHVNSTTSDFVTYGHIYVMDQSN